MSGPPRPGPWFRGRDMTWNPDRQVIEQERQRWVYEQVAEMNETIIDLCVDPVKAYAEHRAIYEETGDLAQLRLALEYVQP